MRHFAVVGRSLKHSFSPEYFAEKFEKEKIHDALYSAIEIPSVDLLEKLLHNHTLDGFNVTIPYKEQIKDFLDSCDPVAEMTGSVNCVKRTGNRYHGYNTDTIGFEQTLRPMISHRKVKALVLGTGGASKAVIYVLNRLIIPYRQVSRKDGPDLIYRQLTPSIIKSHDLIINCTPLGTWPDVENKPDLSYHALSGKSILYDLTYNPRVSAFLKEGLKRGAAVRNGYEMLRIQADESWKIWNTSERD